MEAGRDLGERLKARRNSLTPKPTQQEVADKIGVTAATISLGESGRNLPGSDLLEAWAEALGFKPKEIKELQEMRRSVRGRRLSQLERLETVEAQIAELFQILKSRESRRKGQ